RTHSNILFFCKPASIWHKYDRTGKVSRLTGTLSFVLFDYRLCQAAGSIYRETLIKSINVIVACACNEAGSNTDDGINQHFQPLLIRPVWAIVPFTIFFMEMRYACFALH